MWGPEWDELADMWGIEEVIPRPIEEIIEEIGEGPFGCIPMSLTERSIIRARWQANALAAGLDPRDSRIVQAVEKRLDMTPFTRYAGD